MDKGHASRIVLALGGFGGWGESLGNEAERFKAKHKSKAKTRRAEEVDSEWMCAV